MKIRYFAGAGVILAFLVCFLIDRLVVSGDTFSTGATTNTIPGNVTVTGSAQFNSTLSMTNDVVLTRDAANTLALRNGGTAGAHVAQAFNLYNFWQDASNYEQGFLAWTGNTLVLGTTQAGTGSSRSISFFTPSDINFQAGGSTRWSVQGSSGLFYPASDNAVDIGWSSGKTRSIYVGTSILLGTNVLSFSGTNLTWNGTTITVP